MDDRRIAEADVHGGGAGDALERAVEHLDAERLGLLGARLHIGLVDLHDVGTGCEQVLDFGVDGRGIVESQRHLVLVVVVLRLLAHGEGAGHGDLDRPVGVGAQELHVAHLYRMAPLIGPTTRGTGLGDRCGRARAGIVDIDAVERRGEAVGVALAAHLAVGDDVEAGALLVADGDQCGVVLRLFKPFGRDAPELPCAHARRKALAELLAVNQPVGLGVAPTNVVGSRGSMGILPSIKLRIFPSPGCGRSMGFSGYC